MPSTPAAMNGDALLESSLHFDIQYAGVIADIPSDLDLTGRTDFLTSLDRAQNDGYKIYDPEGHLDAILVLNPYSIWILERRTEETLLTIPVHMLAAVCFVREDSRNIIGLKIGEVGNFKDISDLAVLFCETPELAEMICANLERCFQLVFGEATSQFFDKKITEGANTSLRFFSGSATDSYVSTPVSSNNAEPSFLSGSRANLLKMQSRSQPQNSSTTHSESDQLSADAADLIQEYIRMLHATLSSEELKQFAILLKRWRADNLPFSEFFQKVLELYGSERKYLLARMRPFIPENELTNFEHFLELSGFNKNTTRSGSLKDRASQSGRTPRDMEKSASNADESSLKKRNLIARFLSNTVFKNRTSSSPGKPNAVELFQLKREKSS